MRHQPAWLLGAWSFCRHTWRPLAWLQLSGQENRRCDQNRIPAALPRHPMRGRLLAFGNGEVLAPNLLSYKP